MHRHFNIQWYITFTEMFIKTKYLYFTYRYRIHLQIQKPLQRMLSKEDSMSFSYPLSSDTLSFCQVYRWWKPGVFHSRQSETVAYYLSCVFCICQWISITLVNYLQNVDMSSFIYVWIVFVVGLCLLIHNTFNGKTSV